MRVLLAKSVREEFCELGFSWEMMREEGGTLAITLDGSRWCHCLMKV